jgi:hypothetical protein
MRRELAVLAFVLASSAPAGADVLEGSVTTLLNGRADPRDGVVYTVVPLYQLVRLELRDVQVGLADKYVSDLRLEVSGWGAGLLGEPAGGQRATGDLDVGYLEGSFIRRRIKLRLGRQVVTGGAARFTHVDGASIAVQLFRGLEVRAFGGVPVIPRFGVTVGEATGGGALAYRFTTDSHIAVSFAHIQDQGRAARQDLGIDFRAVPHRLIWITGLGVVSLLEKQMAEVDLAMTTQPVRRFDLRVDYRFQTPNLWIPRSSIMAVFSDESRHEAGGQLDYRPHPRVGLLGDYHVIHDDTGFGHRAGVRGLLHLGPVRQMTVGADLRLLLLTTKGYYETRLWWMLRILSTLVATIDLDAYFFDRQINGRTYSLTGAASLGWDFHPSWRVLVSAAGKTTPFVEGGYDWMVKLAYSPTLRFREVHK